MSVNRSERAGGDRGIAVVFSALLLVVLLIFAALAVDLGGVYSARRNDQNAADVSALGGAQSLTDTNANLIAEVKQLANSTLGTTLTPEQWNSCADVIDPDSVDTALSGANCITVNTGRTQIQVRIPTRPYEAVFAGAAGVDSFDHDAFAIAGLSRFGFGSVLPFGLGTGAGAGDGYLCVKTGPGGHSEPPCGGPESGNFGYLDFGYFGNSEINTTNDCGNGGQKTRNENNAAVGIDHDLSSYGGYWGVGVEHIDTASPCGSIEKPNAAFTLTGNTPQNFGHGMYSGTGYSDGGPGRLARSGTSVFGGSGAAANVGGRLLDDNPLWQFIPTTFPAGANVPASCSKSIFTDARSGVYTQLPTAPANVRAYVSTRPTLAERMRVLLQRCITHYNGSSWNADGAITPVGDPLSGCTGACSDPVFSRNSSTTDSPDLYDIQYTSRFGYVPELTAAFPNGNATVRLATFRPIFFQRLLAGNCGGGTCSHDFEPGIGYSNSSSEEKAEGITAFVLPRSSLPGDLGDEDAPSAVGVNRFVRLIR
jgi:hypothetical protein